MPEEKEENKEKKGLLDIRLIIVAIAIIILAAGIAYVVARMVVEPKVEDEVVESTVSKNIGPIFEMDEFTVNLAEGRRFLRTQIVFVMSENGLRKEIDQKTPLIRDKIITILGEKSISDIQTAIGKDSLKQEIISDMNDILVTGEIEEIYFYTFVFQ
ncbi:MAG: flagellar basal body-associated FliL family protein [Bacillota bacterium]|nr:flagellar basal body-associated FliL family protein [Bacillota bacterium]